MRGWVGTWLVVLGLVGVVSAAGPGRATAAPSAAAATSVPQVTVNQVGFRGVSLAIAVSGTDYFRTWLEYGTSPGFGTVCCGESVLQAGTYTLNSALLTMQAGTTYHLRAFTTEGLGYGGPRTDGPVITFTTKPAEPPAFTATQTVWNNDCFCVNVQGGIKTNGAETSVHFEYGKTAALGSVSETQHVDVDPWGAEWLFNHQIRDLAQGTTYYWRTVLENAAGITKTTISTFTTGTPPPPLPPPPGSAFPPTTPPPLPNPPTVPSPPPAAPAPAVPATPTPTPAGPKLLARATISGSPRVGARLHGKPGKWSSGTRLATVRWLGCRAGTCRTIGHKTTLQLRPAHIGMRVRFEARATKGQKTAWSLSAWSLRVSR